MTGMRNMPKTWHIPWKGAEEHHAYIGERAAYLAQLLQGSADKHAVQKEWAATMDEHHAAY